MKSRLVLVAATVFLSPPYLCSPAQDAAAVAPVPAVAPEPDLKACEEWKQSAIDALDAQLNEANEAYKQAMKKRDTEQMKATLATKKQIAKKLADTKAKTLEECWTFILEERAKAEAREAEIVRQRVVWDAAETDEKAKKESAASKAKNDEEILRRHREFIKNGRKILTRAEFKEKVKTGMTPSQVIEAVGAPGKTQESGDSKSFIYLKKTIDDLTGKDDTLVMVNFWHGKVRSITIP